GGVPGCAECERSRRNQRKITDDHGILPDACLFPIARIAYPARCDKPVLIECGPSFGHAISLLQCAKARLSRLGYDAFRAIGRRPAPTMAPERATRQSACPRVR